MLTRSLILICLMLSACGPELKPGTEQGYHKDFTLYVQNFNVYMQKYNRKPYNESYLITYSEHLSANQLGLCKLTRQRSVIYINTKHWFKLSEGSKQQLIDHEMGHCFLNVGHTSSGLMQSTAFSGSLYLEHRDYYMRQLFELELPNLIM